MAERSNAQRDRRRAHPFSRGRLVVGLVLVALVAAGMAWGLGRLRDEPGPGRLFYAGPRGVYIHDLGTGDERRAGTLPGAGLASISRDGRWVAYLTDGRLLLTDLIEDEDLEVVVADRLTVPLGWTPDDRLVAGELLSDGDVVAVDPEGARELLFSGIARGATPVWLDDERFAVSRTSDEFVIVEDRKAVVAGSGVPLAASPDGSELFVQRAKNAFVMKVEGRQLTDERVLFDGEVRRAANSPRGFLAIAGTDHKRRDGVWVFEGGTDVQRVFDKKVDWLGWSAESSHLLYARRGVVYAQRLPDGEPKPVSRKGVKVFPVFSFTVVP